MALFAGYGGPFPEGFDDYAPGTISRTTQKGLTQELRLQQSDPNERLNWVVGVFYLRSEVRDAFDAADPQLLSVINFGQTLAGLPQVASVAELYGVDLYQGIYSVTQRVSYRDVERSLFAQADYELLAGLKVTAGLRYTAADFEYGNFIAGPLYATDGASSNLESSSSPVTPKLGLSYQANDDNLFYANAAKGVRGSGVADALGERCAADAAAIGIDALTPRDVKPDTIWSYEIGSKNKLFDGRVGVDLAAYHVDWTDVQTTLVLPVCQLNTTFNLGSAKIDGVDLALSLQPLLGLSLGVAASYIDARYTTDLPGPDDIIIRRKGEPLDVAPWSVHLSGEYEFSLARYDAYARADYSYTSHNNTPLDLSSPLVDPSLPRAPKTTRLDIRAGMRFGDLDVSLFVENLLNDHPVLSLGHDSLDSENYRTTTYRPRTIGLTATYRK
jgi:outer membrane receptor protein involved in Fe transport